MKAWYCIRRNSRRISHAVLYAVTDPVTYAVMVMRRAGINLSSVAPEYQRQPMHTRTWNDAIQLNWTLSALPHVAKYVILGTRLPLSGTSLILADFLEPCGRSWLYQRYKNASVSLNPNSKLRGIRRGYIQGINRLGIRST